MPPQTVEDAQEEIGRLLAALRKEAGFTQVELSRAIGFQRSTVAGAESGKGAGVAFWEQCDRVLKTKGRLVAEFQKVEQLRRQHQAAAAQSDKAQRLALISQWDQSHDNLTRDLGFSVRSNKFIAAFVGPEIAADLASRERASKSEEQWMPCHHMPVGHSGGSCKLHVWPFGSAVFHLVEEQDFDSIADLAIWRIRSYEENMLWASAQLTRMSGGLQVNASYVLSAYWLEAPTWGIDAVETALRIMCTPRVLLRRDLDDSEDPKAFAEQVERKLLTEGYEHPEISRFGVNGIANGFASWSGVVYHPIAPEQALQESELVACELATQALWVYCQHINNQVENGQDPVVHDSHGWRFLRGAKSRLVNPRPQETGQHRSMRDAILETSGLLTHLDQAIEALRQT